MNRLRPSLKNQSVSFVAGIQDSEVMRYLSILVEAISDSLVLIEILSEDDYRVLAVNNRFLEDTGFEKDQIVGKKVEEVVGGQRYSDLLEKYCQAIGSGESVVYEEKYSLPLGERYFKNQIIPVSFGDGVTHLLVVASNFTMQREVEEKLKLASKSLDQLAKMEPEQLIAEIAGDCETMNVFQKIKDRYQNFFCHVPLMMQVVDADGIIIEVNDFWLKTLGYKEAEVLGKASVSFLTKASRQQVLEVWLPLFYKLGMAKDVPLQFLTKDGRCVDVLLTSIAEKDEAGNYLRGMAVMIDVTEQKRIELALKESEENYRLIAEASADGIYRLDEKGDFLFVNNSYCRMTGYDREYLMKANFCQVVPKNIEKRIYAAYLEMVENPGEREGEFVLCRNEGGVFPVYYNMIPVMKHGVATGYVGVIRDISHEKQLEETKAQLLSDAAHELRTPLAIMKSNLDLLKLQVASEVVDLPQMLKNLDGEIDYLSRIVSDISLLAETNHEARHQLNYEGIELEGFLQNVVSKFEAVAMEKSIDIVFAKSEPVIIPADFEVLHRLFTNLISNAIRYGRTKGWVKVYLEQKGGFAEIRVADNGMGIRKRDMLRIFERFYRVDKARSRSDGGSGLGLSICKWVAEAHGGSIDVESRFGRGSTFVVRLPLGNA